MFQPSDPPSFFLEEPRSSTIFPTLARDIPPYQQHSFVLLPILQFFQFEFEYVLIFLYCKQPQPSQSSKEPYEYAWVFVYVFQLSSLYPFLTPRVHIKKVEIENPAGRTGTLMNKNETHMKENVTPTNDTKAPMKETQAPSEPPSFTTNMMHLDSQVEI